MIIRRAERTRHLNAAVELVRAAELSVAGVAEHIEHFFVALDGRERICGVVGLELYRRCGLLRSLVVAPEERRAGSARSW